MFTGLVRERGRVVEAGPSERGGVRLAVEASPELTADLGLGASLAVSGVCLTVVELGGRRMAAEVGPETLSRTTLGEWVPGTAVNLEPSLRAGDPMGGHWVQGHVDATLSVVRFLPEDDHVRARFELPAALARYVAEKGSVAIDGVSLTVASVDVEGFEVALVPHTLEVTTLGALAPGRRVNFEADILAKYVERAVAAARPSAE